MREKAIILERSIQTDLATDAPGLDAHSSGRYQPGNL
jgi:hypothetical protein